MEITKENGCDRMNITRDCDGIVEGLNSMPCIKVKKGKVTTRTILCSRLELISFTTLLSLRTRFCLRNTNS